MNRLRRSREGAALLVVLILVAILSIVAVVVLDDVRFSIRRAQNVEVQTQSQWIALGAERLARRRIRQLIDADAARTPAPEQWDGRRFDFPIEGGALSLTVRDGQSCFNLNSLVEGAPGAWVPNPVGQAQFAAFLSGIGVPAAALGQAIADRISASGALLVEPSELRALPSMDEATYRRLRPFVCALPVAELSRFNVNSLTPDDAPLLAMLAPDQLSVDAARSAIATRPARGWADIDAFWASPALAALALTQAEREQATVVTRYFDFDARVAWAGGEASRSGLIEVGRDGRVRSVLSRWAPAD
ncbi:type II secretion system minor pseudopilin GspK [Brevundimonas balnearis]|uniref:Type II secretion system protein K n=1 Tax=Brevundimonas balnearis TaxID=1572858 RepID=A0ABV6R733_9CAUL